MEWGRVGGGVRAAAVGAVLGVGWLLGAGPVADGMCRAVGGADEGWGCLGVGLLLRPAAAVVGGLAAWVLLALLRVPRASRTAGAGFVVCGLLVWVHDYAAASVRFFDGLVDDAVLLAAGYGLAHVLVAAGTRRNVRVGVAVALLAVWPLSSAAQASSADRAQRHRLETASVPLLAPRLPGYRALFPVLQGITTRTFHYLVLADGTASDAKDRDEHGLWVTVAPRPSAFTPPANCDAEENTATAHLSPCTPVAAGVWRVQRDGFRWYVAEPPGDVYVVVLTAKGTAVPEEDVLTMAADLHPRDAGFFSDR